MKIGLKLHPDRKKVSPVLPEILSVLANECERIFVPESYKKFADGKQVFVMEKGENFTAHDIDLLISIGGDGTYIGAARSIAGTDIPILGIHLGGLGFLAEVLPHKFKEKIRDYFSGNYKIEKRKILEAEIVFNDYCKKYYCINDILINRNESMSMGKFVTYVDGEYLNTYRGDSLIISTPSGSTAYNLSAGGPIISPHLDVITLTPVCPHSLSARPIILGGDQIITFDLKSSHRELALDIDGQERIAIKEAKKVIVRNSRSWLNIVRFDDYSFFHTLQTKLNWGVDKRNE
jgi:NAD+ kinase